MHRLRHHRRYAGRYRLHVTRETETNKTLLTDDRPRSSGNIPILPTDNSNRHNSKPIAIDLPSTVRKINTAPVYTPPEPVSARGDLPGYVIFPPALSRLTRKHRKIRASKMRRRNC